MKAKWLLWLCVLLPFSVQAQTNTTAYGQPWFFAVDFGQWNLHSQQANVYTFSPASLCTSTANGIPFFDFNINAPVLIADPIAANSDIVTPSGIQNNGAQCGINVAPAHQHFSFTLSSATAGLQESLNALSVSSATTAALIILDRRWYQALGGIPGASASAIIASVKGSTMANIMDITPANPVNYAWNGSQYVVSLGPGGSTLTPGGIQYGASSTHGTNATSAQIVAALNTSPSTLLSSSLIPTLNQNTTGNAATATALAALPTPCSAGNAPTGILANGNSTGCAAIGGSLPDSSLVLGSNSSGAGVAATYAQIAAAGNIAPVNFGYTFYESGSTYFARNNSTMNIDYSGSDAGVVINAAINNIASTCGHLYFEPGIYTINSLVAETTSGYTNYYAIGLPALPAASQYCQWFIYGDSSNPLGLEETGTTLQTAGVIFNVTSTAVATVASTVVIDGIWQRPDAAGSGIAATDYLQNIDVRFPTNQRGNEAEIDMSQAESFNSVNVKTDFAIAGVSLAFPVAGASGLYGIVTTNSSHTENYLQNTFEVGTDVCLDARTEHLIMVNSFGAFCDYAIDYGLRGGNIYHASSLISSGWQESAHGLTIGTDVQAGALLDISGLDMEDAASGIWAPVYHAKEITAGNTFGRISYDRVIQGTGISALASLFDGGGGTSFITQNSANVVSNGTYTAKQFAFSGTIANSATAQPISVTSNDTWSTAQALFHNSNAGSATSVNFENDAGTASTGLQLGGSTSTFPNAWFEYNNLGNNFYRSGGNIELGPGETSGFTGKVTACSGGMLDIGNTNCGSGNLLEIGSSEQFKVDSSGNGTAASLTTPFLVVNGAGGTIANSAQIAYSSGSNFGELEAYGATTSTVPDMYIIGRNSNQTTNDVYLHCIHTNGCTFADPVAAQSYAGSGTATFTAQAAAGTSPGTPTCVTSHVCDSYSGEVVMTTGTSTSTGNFLTVTLGGVTRTNLPTCYLKAYLAASPFTELPLTDSPTTTAITFFAGTAPTASTQYEFIYVCGGI